MASPAPTISIGAKDLHLTGGSQQIQSAQIEQLFMYIYIVAGFVAIIVIVIGGIRYATSAGDSSSVQSAKNTVQYAVVGLVVIIMAAAITDFVIKNVAK
jgi:heme/copper-type cytochrome/quinol oxidase subunit 2